MHNLAFATRLQLGDTKGCTELLVKTNRAPEAALFARTYIPRFDGPRFKASFLTHAYVIYSLVPELVQSWQKSLEDENRSKLAAAIASPTENPELFSEGWEEALEREKDQEQQKTVHVNGFNGEFLSLFSEKS